MLADANLEAAADAAVMGCFYLAGQVCTAAERVLVHSDVHDRFVDLLVERTRLLQIGDPLDEATDMGPMCNAVTLERTKRTSRTRSTTVRSSSMAARPTGMYHEPTILTGVTSEMAIAQRGDVRARRADHALRLARGGDRDRQRDRVRAHRRRLHNTLNDAWHAAAELRHGTVHINETTNYWDQMAPFGGAKSSGSGRELADGIADAVTETKQITFDWS